MHSSNLRPGHARFLFDVRFGALSFALASALAAAPVIAAAQTAPPPQAPRAPRPPATAPAEPQGAARSEALPSARSILDRHIEAIGGRKAVLAHTSSHASGTMLVAGSGITGTVEVYSAKPDKSLMKVTLGGIGDVLEGYDGTTAWSLSPMTGPMLATGKELEQKKFDAAFYSELHEPGRYVSMKTVEKTMFEGRPCYKVSLVKSDSSEDLELYDVQTGLKAGATATRESPMGPMSVTQVQADYKKFGGVLVPTTLKQSAMGVQQIFTITAIEFDNVAPAVFDPPAAIKALVAK